MLFDCRRREQWRWRRHCTRIRRKKLFSYSDTGWQGNTKKSKGKQIKRRKKCAGWKPRCKGRYGSLEIACHTWGPYGCVHDKALYKSTFATTFYNNKRDATEQCCQDASGQWCRTRRRQPVHRSGMLSVLPLRLTIMPASCSFFSSLFSLNIPQPLIGNSLISLCALNL